GPVSPAFAVDRRRASALTASTLTASMMAVGAVAAAIAGGVAHMGNHPLGANFQPNPRFRSERTVAPDALNMGATAENLHDQYPALTRQRADSFAAESQRKYAEALAAGFISPDLVPIGIADPERG